MNSFFFWFIFAAVVGYALMAFIPLFVKIRNAYVLKLLQIVWIVLTIGVLLSMLALVYSLITG